MRVKGQRCVLGPCPVLYYEATAGCGVGGLGSRTRVGAQAHRPVSHPGSCTCLSSWVMQLLLYSVRAGVCYAAWVWPRCLPQWLMLLLLPATAMLHLDILYSHLRNGIPMGIPAPFCTYTDTVYT